jgi:hypothetical protein
MTISKGQSSGSETTPEHSSFEEYEDLGSSEQQTIHGGRSPIDAFYTPENETPVETHTPWAKRLDYHPYGNSTLLLASQDASIFPFCCPFGITYEVLIRDTHVI